MPFTGEQKKQYNKKYFQSKQQAKIEGEKAKEDFDKCALLDAEEKTACNEVLSYLDLCKIYYGVDRGEDPNKSTYKRNTEKRIVVAGKQILKSDYTFWTWLEGRQQHYKDFWLFMHTARGTWNEQGHKPLAEFFGNKDNSMLQKGYSEDDLKEFVLAQGGEPNALLLYPRAFRKSTVNVLDCAHWIINSHGDIVILVITSTNPLGHKFVRLLRSFFEVKDYDNPTDLQKFFPEHCITEGAGDQKFFWSPQRSLGLKDPTLTAKSMESSGFAGTRAHILKFDDSVDEENWKTVESRLKVLEKYDAAGELIEAPYGRTHVIGTRWTNGRPDDFIDEDGVMKAVPDLYGTILDREEKASVKSLKTLIAAAWTPHEDAVNKDLLDLTQDDVTLLCPGKGPGSYEVLRKKLEKNRMQFECQQLNRPAMKQDRDLYLNPFTEARLTQCMTDISWVEPKIPNGKIFNIWDTAHSTRKNADFSAGVVYFIEELEEKDPIAWLLECSFGRWSNSELAQKIVALHKKWNPQATLIEELVTTSDLFKNEIRNEQLRQQVGTPWSPVWFKPDSQPKAKEVRINNLEPLMTNGRFKICIGNNTNAVYWIEELKKEFLGYTGHKSNKNAVGGRHDDLIDAAAYLYKIMPMGVRTEADKDLDDRLAERERRNRLQSMIFGSSISIITTPGTPIEQAPSNPIYDALSILNQRGGPTVSFPKRNINRDGN